MELKRIILIALRCVDPEVENRPNIGDDLKISRYKLTYHIIIRIRIRIRNRNRNRNKENIGNIGKSEQSAI
ncbi:hypothetical protein QVD17_35649 [Tagetes erecta]|uniref:Uncharacterized protein n=1 Tax=Tagetes erecta TaxID=13708 RepID=A0AAD8JT76_TARER|nr:hypothetical protein QVD17_35649 [Tagetes erecta]